MSLAIGGTTRPSDTRELAASSLRTAAAVAPAPEPAVDAGAWGIGKLRLQEAQQELAQRRDFIIAASRSDARPSFVWPAKGPLSGWFGERRRSHGHVGVDVDGDTGDAIVAAGSGVVEWAGWAPSGYSGYGQMVLIRHSSGVQTLYAHLSRLATTTGAVVEAGDYIGAMGTTGNVTGSHLHFEVRIGGTPVNPANWLPGR